MPGHHDASNEYTSVDDAINATEYAIEFGLAGIIRYRLYYLHRGFTKMCGFFYAKNMGIKSWAHCWFPSSSLPPPKN